MNEAETIELLNSAVKLLHVHKQHFLRLQIVANIDCTAEVRLIDGVVFDLKRLSHGLKNGATPTTIMSTIARVIAASKGIQLIIRKLFDDDTE